VGNKGTHDSSAYASQQLSMLDDMLAALSSRYDLRDLLQHLSTVICRIVPYDEAQLVLLTEDGSPSLYARTRDGAWEETAGKTAGTVLDDIEPQVFDVVPESDRGLRYGLKVPVKIDDRLVGAFTLFSRDPQGYSASDLLHAQRLANYLGHGLAYQRLAEQARNAAVERQRSTEITSRCRYRTSSS
jgi:GAF domain-containing protein